MNPLRAIALFKFAKASTLALVAAGMASTLGSAMSGRWHHLLSLASGHRWLIAAIEQVAGWTAPQRFALVGLALSYAALFAIEGVGLWRGRRWGEWLTVAVTSLLIPFEILELLQHRSPWVALVLAVNIAIVVWLFRQLRWRRTLP